MGCFKLTRFRGNQRDGVSGMHKYMYHFPARGSFLMDGSKNGIGFDLINMYYLLLVQLMI